MASLSLSLSLGLLAGCGPQSPPPKTIGHLDLARYAGTWAEAARFANTFQDNSDLACVNVTATYTATATDRVAVRNQCDNAKAPGSQKLAEGRAYVVEHNGAKLRVTFFWPFYGDYWVIGLADDYSWAVVGDRGRKYLWVLARHLPMSKASYASAVAIAAAQGFDTARLVKTLPQD